MMAIIAAEETPKLIFENKLELQCVYNNTGQFQSENKESVAALNHTSGLPSLSSPLMVNNLMYSDKNLVIGHGQGIILPENTAFTLNVSYLSKTGFQLKITTAESGKIICGNQVHWVSPSLSNDDYQTTSVSTWDHGSALITNNSGFDGTQSDYALRTFRIVLEATRLDSVEAVKKGDVTTIRTSAGDTTTMVVDVLIMNEKYYQKNIISFDKQPQTLGD